MNGLLLIEINRTSAVVSSDTSQSTSNISSSVSLCLGFFIRRFLTINKEFSEISYHLLLSKFSCLFNIEFTI